MYTFSLSLRNQLCHSHKLGHSLRYASTRKKALARHENALKKDYDKMRQMENNVKIKIDPTAVNGFEVCYS